MTLKWTLFGKKSGVVVYSHCNFGLVISLNNHSMGTAQWNRS